MTEQGRTGQNQVTRIAVTGMTCDHCAASVTEELTELQDVLSVRIDEVVKGGTTDVFVESVGPLDLPAARAAVEEAGYTASV